MICKVNDMKYVKYRIVTDNYLGYECQIKYWFTPFFSQIGLSNTHKSIEDAKVFIKKHKKGRKKFKPKVIELDL